LNGSLNDALGGPALTADGGTLNASNYTFGANQGLTLTGGFGPSGVGNFAGSYSIVLDFTFDNLSGFRKIIDFQDKTSDNGTYNLNTAINFFPAITGPSGALTTTNEARVVLTRDGTTVAGYVNGVSQFTFTDGGNAAVFSAANNIAHFFEDDSKTGGEASSGEVNRILIYQDALTAAEVAQLAAPTPSVPEPASLALWSFGLAGALIVGYGRMPCHSSAASR
jgi:hypothetical protein